MVCAIVETEYIHTQSRQINCRSEIGRIPFVYNCMSSVPLTAYCHSERIYLFISNFWRHHKIICLWLLPLIVFRNILLLRKTNNTLFHLNFGDRLTFIYLRKGGKKKTQTIMWSWCFFNRERYREKKNYFVFVEINI